MNRARKIELPLIDFGITLDKAVREHVWLESDDFTAKIRGAIGPILVIDDPEVVNGESQ